MRNPKVAVVRLEVTRMGCLAFGTSSLRPAGAIVFDFDTLSTFGRQLIWALFLRSFAGCRSDFAPREFARTQFAVAPNAQQGARANTHSRHASCFGMLVEMNNRTDSPHFARVTPAVPVAHL